MTLDRRKFLKSTLLTAAATAWPAGAQERPAVSAKIDTRQVPGPLAHVWSECAGSDRAAITLREDWRQGLDRWRTEAGLKRVRFHGIFNDELGVYAPSILNRRKPVQPNFQNIDRVYDGLQARGVSPLIELSFIPKSLASGEGAFGFYASNISPPTSINAWADFIESFAAHLVDRYGAAVVRDWPFEVWNEPNLTFFWSGNQQQYFDLYKATSVAIKSVDSKLKVGGPSTSYAQWITEFAAYCTDNNAPVDFVSAHVYAGDNQSKVFGVDRQLSQADVIPEGIAQARRQLDATGLRSKPLWLTEWFSDSPAMIAHIIAGCLPHCEGMSHWTLSQTYEELGVADYLLKVIICSRKATWALARLCRESRYRSSIPASCCMRWEPHGFRRKDPCSLLVAARRSRRWCGILLMLRGPEAFQVRVRRDPSRVMPNEWKSNSQEIAPASARRCASLISGEARQCLRGARWVPRSTPTFHQIQLLRQRAEIPPATMTKLDASRRLVLELPPEGVALIELGEK